MLPRAVAVVVAAGFLVLPSDRASCQEPAGLGARALADTAFVWVRDSLPGLRVYFLEGTYPFAHRDSLKTNLVAAAAHARKLINAPPMPGPIDVFFIESREQMRALTGAPVTGFAHTSARAVFIVTNPEWRAFDRHEIMHVVAAQAWRPIGGSNPWLQEGLAQAADGWCSGYTNSDVAIALAKKHGWIDLETMLTKFREQGDLRAYLQAASFIAYLLPRVGADAIRELWTIEVAPTTLVAARPLSAWDAEWRATLKATRDIPPKELEAIEAIGCGIR